MGLIADLETLNQADLAQLQRKLAGMRAELEALLKQKGAAANRTLSDAELQAASASMGLSLDELLAALEWARQLT